MTAHPAAAATPLAPIISARGTAIGYGDHPVVQDVDFDIHRGEVVAVLGANGSGKSTLIRGFLGLAQVMGGTLELFGIPSAHFHDRHRIGYVPQRHTVVGSVPSTVREVVSSGRLPLRRLFGRSTAADRAATQAAIDTVGLSDRADANIALLSGGQQRRALIARALAAEPDILIMDEPTAGVDAENQRILARTLGRLVEAGTTLLIVTHEVGPLAVLVDRALVLRDGQVAYDGPLLPHQIGASDGAEAHHHGAAPALRPGVGLTG